MAEQKETVEVDNRPTSQKDLEQRLKEGFLPEHMRVNNVENEVLNPEVVNAPYASEEMDISAYRGTDPVYMQYANEFEKPCNPTEGVEAEALKLLSGGVAGVFKQEGAPVGEAGTVVGGGKYETLNTVVSGDDYSAKLVDKPAEQVQTNGVGLDLGQVKSDDTTAAPKAAVAAKHTAPAAKPGPSK